MAQYPNRNLASAGAPEMRDLDDSQVDSEFTRSVRRGNFSNFKEQTLREIAAEIEADWAVIINSATDMV
jgi:hypothetical protein